MRRLRAFPVPLSICPVALGPASFTGTASAPVDPSELARRIRALEKVNGELGAVVRSQRATILALSTAAGECRDLKRTTPGPGQSELPEGARQFIYNGTTFYVIAADSKR